MITRQTGQDERRVAGVRRPPRALVLLIGALAATTALGGCGGQATRDSTSSMLPTATARTGAISVEITQLETTGAAAAVHTSAARFSKVWLTIPAANRAFGASHQVTLPRGWKAEVWALVPDARLEAWTPEGRLLASSPDSGSIFELTPRRSASAVPASRTLISGLDQPQGLTFAKLGGQEYLFVAETDEIDRYRWNNGRPNARKVIAANLPTGGAHPLKNVVVSARGTVYFDIGSASNADPPSGTTVPRATVMAVNADGSHLRVFARGVRNGDGLSFAPNGTLWTAVNERDDIAYPFHRGYGGHSDAYGLVIQSYVNQHPPDELAALTAGRNLGWPYCDPDPDTALGQDGTAFNYANMRFTADQQTNAGGGALNCAKLKRIERGLPAHSAPLGFHFLVDSKLPAAWRGGAVVATHGSWDRQPPRAPVVYWLPWEAKAHTLGAPITLMAGFQSSDGTRWGRPVDAVAGPDGALYVSDDTAGVIYRLVPARG